MEYKFSKYGVHFSVESVPISKVEECHKRLVVYIFINYCRHQLFVIFNFFFTLLSIYGSFLFMPSNVCFPLFFCRFIKNAIGKDKKRRKEEKKKREKKEEKR